MSDDQGATLGRAKKRARLDLGDLLAEGDRAGEAVGMSIPRTVQSHAPSSPAPATPLEPALPVKPKIARLTVDLPEDLVMSMKLKAVRERTSVKKIILAAVQSFIS